jgi:hypothetical protein
MTDRYVDPSDLPECVQTALRLVGHSGRKSVGVTATTQYASGCCTSGSRAVYVSVHIGSGSVHELHYGSWGGANPFESLPGDSMVDIAPGWCVVGGQTGGRTYVNVYAHPDTLDRVLPTPVAEPELTEDEIRVLCVHVSLNSRGRKNYFGRRPTLPVDACKARLADLGLLKVARNGASKVTTEGRNTAEQYRYTESWY